MAAPVFLAKVLNMTLSIVAGRWWLGVRGAVLAGALALTTALALADDAPPGAPPDVAATAGVVDAVDPDGAQTPSVESPQLGLRPPLAGALAVGAGAGTGTDADADSADVSAYKPLVSKITPPRQEYGLASWYGAQLHRKRTASGERFDMHALTAAHRTLPFGSLVCVRSLTTGREVVVRINDRGPHTPGRVIDLSRAAADALGMLDLGTKQVALFDSTDEGECPDS